MFNPDFINKIIIPYNILNKNEAEILSYQCQKINIPSEVYLLVLKVLTKQAVIDLNSVKDGYTGFSDNEIKGFFDRDLLKNEIRKLIDKQIPNKVSAENKVIEVLEASSIPQPGDIIDKYEIGEIIGKGATATVYKAFHQVLKIDVALKVLAPQLIYSDPLIKDKFIDEARNTAKLSHNNLIKIIDADRSGIYTYIVMEYIEGETLDEIISKRGAMPPLTVINILMELCKVLESVSLYGLIHRDIKPANIMITSQSEVKLADFGLAIIINEPDKYQTISGKIYGTPYYMSPEQFVTPEKVDIRSDLYSLGATVYHMVTGQLPFDTNSLQKILYMHLYEKPLTPYSILNKTGVELSNIIMKLMEKDPERRYQNYSELFTDLNGIVSSYQESKQKKAEIKFRDQHITFNMDFESFEKCVELIKENPVKIDANQAEQPAYSLHS